MANFVRLPSGWAINLDLVTDVVPSKDGDDVEVFYCMSPEGIRAAGPDASALRRWAQTIAPLLTTEQIEGRQKIEGLPVGGRAICHTTDGFFTVTKTEGVASSFGGHIRMARITRDDGAVESEDRFLDQIPDFLRVEVCE